MSSKQILQCSSNHQIQMTLSTNYLFDICEISFNCIGWDSEQVGTEQREGWNKITQSPSLQLMINRNVTEIEVMLRIVFFGCHLSQFICFRTLFRTQTTALRILGLFQYDVGQKFFIIKVMSSHFLGDHLTSSPLIRHNDSLVFSITAEKSSSPHDTDLLKNSYDQNTGSNQLFDLAAKLKDLEGQVQSIKTQSNQNPLVTTAAYENIDMSNITLGEDHFKPGAFVRKKNPTVHPFQSNPSTKTTKRTVSRDNNKTHSIRHRDHSNSMTESQANTLRKQLLRLKLKEQKNKRSASRYSERLSESKQSLKRLKQQNRKYDNIVNNLNRELRKSETIRAKQKETIMKQKREIEQLRNIVAVMNKATRQVSTLMR